MKKAMIAAGLGLTMCSSTPPPAHDGGLDASTDGFTADAAVDVASDGGCNLTASADVSGTLGGVKMTPIDAFALQGDPQANDWFVLATDAPGVCTRIGTNQTPANAKLLVIQYTGAGVPKPGTVDMPSPSSEWDIEYFDNGPTCDTLYNEYAPTGSFTIASIGPCGVVISAFDFQFTAGNSGPNDHITGSITAPTCSSSGDGGKMTCN